MIFNWIHSLLTKPGEFVVQQCRGNPPTISGAEGWGSTWPGTSPTSGWSHLISLCVTIKSLVCLGIRLTAIDNVVLCVSTLPCFATDGGQERWFVMESPDLKTDWYRCLNWERPCTQHYNYTRHIYYFSSYFVIIECNGVGWNCLIWDTLQRDDD